MSTILTDDEIKAECRNGYGIDPMLGGNLMEFCRAVEAAVLAKLAQQWPVGFIHPQEVPRLENGETVAFRKVPYIGERQIPVFLRPAPQQADRQRVPNGWKLVPEKPTIEMLSEGACAQSLPGPHYIGSSAASQCWANMLAAAPEAPAQASAVDERAAFEAELRRQCFQKPTSEARDLAWCMWQARAALAQEGGAA